MNKFNSYILLVMRWLQDNDLVSLEELRANHSAAYADVAEAAEAATAASHAYTIKAATSANNAAYFAARAAYADDSAVAKNWLSKTENYLNEYFNLAKEDRGAYEERARHLNILGINNG